MAAQVLVRLETPGYAPEDGAAYFSFTVLPAAGGAPRLAAGTVGAALAEQGGAPPAADAADQGADPDLPTLITDLPPHVTLEAATLSIDAVFTTPARAAALQQGAASAVAGGAAGAAVQSVGTKAATVALPAAGAAGTYDGAGGALYGQGFTPGAAADAGATPVPASSSGTGVTAQVGARM